MITRDVSKDPVQLKMELPVPIVNSFIANDHCQKQLLHQALTITVLITKCYLESFIGLELLLFNILPLIIYVFMYRYTFNALLSFNFEEKYSSDYSLIFLNNSFQSFAAL